MLLRQREADLIAWKNSSIHKPLLVRGARQVGKSCLIEQFGRKHFEHTVVVNFELAPHYKKCFHSLSPSSICDAIATISQQPIIPGKTLLFLDEIQDCPEAIQALRYFKENLPDLHVIGAGSLLELALKNTEYRMPVGRVAFLYLYPLSFKEFLQAFNPEAIAYLEKATLQQPIPEAIHDHLLKKLRLYWLIGGMPEAMQDYRTQQQILSVQAIQASILETYQRDFGHYAEFAKPAHIQRCFQQIPRMIGQQIKYNKIDPDLRSRELKEALDTLEAIGVTDRIQASSGQGLPLDATVNDKKFKLNFIDVGLVKRINQLDASLLLNEDLMLLNDGALVEQFVGQELLAYSVPYEKPKLYFWARDNQGTAEVDYLKVIGSTIYPIEVKAGKLGKLKSMMQYRREHRCPFGIRISPPSFEP